MCPPLSDSSVPNPFYVAHDDLNTLLEKTLREEISAKLQKVEQQNLSPCRNYLWNEEAGDGAWLDIRMPERYVIPRQAVTLARILGNRPEQRGNIQALTSPEEWKEGMHHWLDTITAGRLNHIGTSDGWFEMGDDLPESMADRSKAPGDTESFQFSCGSLLDWVPLFRSYAQWGEEADAYVFYVNCNPSSSHFGQIAVIPCDGHGREGLEVIAKNAAELVMAEAIYAGGRCCMYQMDHAQGRDIPPADDLEDSPERELVERTTRVDSTKVQQFLDAVMTAKFGSFVEKVETDRQVIQNSKEAVVEGALKMWGRLKFGIWLCIWKGMCTDFA